MLHKYMHFFRILLDKLIFLKESNSTWIDYFQTVGTELLVLIIGIIYLFVIFIIIYIPIISDIKIIKLIRSKDKFYNLKIAYNNWNNLKTDYKKIRDRIYKHNFIYTEDIRTDLIHLIDKYNLNKIVNIMDFGNPGDSIRDKKYNCININFIRFESQINYYNNVTLYKIKTLKWSLTGDEFSAFNIFADENMILNAEYKYKFKCIISCVFSLIIYVIFLIPFILMLFS